MSLGRKELKPSINPRAFQEEAVVVNIPEEGLEIAMVVCDMSAVTCTGPEVPHHLLNVIADLPSGRAVIRLDTEARY
jgi:hypothetical protein